MKRISILIPVYNEELFIKSFISTLLNQDIFENIHEILFIDGNSNDNTRDFLKKIIKKYRNIKLLINPCKTVPYALNAGIKNSAGDIIIRLDAHAEYPTNYISTLVYYLDKLNADNVGASAITVPSNKSKRARAIAISMSSIFGVGNATFRLDHFNNKEYIEVDTVPFGCYRREVFERIGLFDEQLTRNQDNEFNERLRKAGGKIYLIPSLKIKYYARESYSKLYRMFFQYGYFGPLVDLKLKRPTRLRRYIPTLFVLSLILPLLMMPVDNRFGLVSAISLGLYILASAFFSLYELYRRKNISLFPFLAYAYLVSHISYGIGYIAGVWDFLLKKKHLHKKVEVTLSR